MLFTLQFEDKNSAFQEASVGRHSISEHLSHRGHLRCSTDDHPESCHTKDKVIYGPLKKLSSKDNVALLFKKKIYICDPNLTPTVLSSLNSHPVCALEKVMDLVESVAE